MVQKRILFVAGWRLGALWFLVCGRLAALARQRRAATAVVAGGQPR